MLRGALRSPCCPADARQPLLSPCRSPFDRCRSQHKRLRQVFGDEHRFEVHVPAAQRVFGYFARPVLVGDRIVAALDLKMDRQAGRLLVQKWTWLVPQRPALKRAIEAALQRFERFHLQ